MDAIPMLSVCLDGQTHGLFAGECVRCGAPMNWGYSASAQAWGLCALCAIRDELAK